MSDYYNFIGIDASGKHTQGRIKALDIITLQELLTRQQIHLISAQIIPRLTILKGIFTYRRIATKAVLEWCFQLHLLLKSGIVMADAIDFIILQKLAPAMVVISQQVQRQLAQGNTLSSILQHFPYCFDEVFISLIQMGEKTGGLTSCLEHLLLYLNWQQKLKEQLLRALIYPSLLLMMLSVLLSVLFMVLIPQMQQLLVQHHQELPLATKLLIATSDFFANYTLIIVVGWACIYVTLKISTVYSVKFKSLMARFTFSYPKIGNLLYMVDAERFTFTLKILYKSGIGMIDCLTQAQSSVRNFWLKSQLQKVTTRIVKGELLSQALINEHVFKNYLPTIVAIGEKSGQLAAALDHANQYYTQTLQRRFDVIAALVGPSLILVIGMILIWIALAMFVPIYDQLTVIL